MDKIKAQKMLISSCLNNLDSTTKELCELLYSYDKVHRKLHHDLYQLHSVLTNTKMERDTIIKHTIEHSSSADQITVNKIDQFSQTDQ